MASHLPDRKYRLMSEKTGGKRRNAEETENRETYGILKAGIRLPRTGAEGAGGCAVRCTEIERISGAAGIRRRHFRGGRNRLRMERFGSRDHRQPCLSSGLAGSGIVCIGCAASEEAFFDGAALVTDLPGTA